MAEKPTPKQRQSLTELTKLDKKWQDLKEVYKHLSPPFEISCFSKLKQTLPAHYRVISTGDYYYNGKKSSVEDKLAKELGFHTKDEKTNYVDALAFVKMPFDRSEGALILYLAQKFTGPENYFIRAVKKDEQIWYPLNGGDITYLLKKVVDVKAKTTEEIQRSLKKYLGKEDQREFLEPWQKRLTLRLQEGKRFDKKLWGMLGALDSQFLGRTDVHINGSTISFGAWQDYSHSEAPSFSLDYSVIKKKKIIKDLGTGGDIATAQKIILRVCKEKNIKLPKGTKLEELD